MGGSITNVRPSTSPALTHSQDFYPSQAIRTARGKLNDYLPSYVPFRSRIANKRYACIIMKPSADMLDTVPRFTESAGNVLIEGIFEFEASVHTCSLMIEFSCGETDGLRMRERLSRSSNLAGQGARSWSRSYRRIDDNAIAARAMYEVPIDALRPGVGPKSIWWEPSLGVHNQLHLISPHHQAFATNTECPDRDI
jgi:hypothetical protein